MEAKTLYILSQYANHCDEASTCWLAVRRSTLIGRLTSSVIRRLTTAPESVLRDAVRHANISDSRSITVNVSTINSANLHAQTTSSPLAY